MHDQHQDRRPESGGHYLRHPRAEARPPLPIRHWIVLLVVGFGIYNFVFSDRGLLTLLSLRRETRVLEGQEKVLQAKVDRLVGLREGLASGEAVEKVAREQGHWLRPGEEVYLLPVTPDAGASGDALEVREGEGAGGSIDPGGGATP